MVRSSNFPGNFDNAANLPDVQVTTPLVPAHWNNVKDAVVSVQYALGRRPSSWPTQSDGVERKTIYEVLAGLLGVGAAPADAPVPTWPPESGAAPAGGGGVVSASSTDNGELSSDAPFFYALNNVRLGGSEDFEMSGSGLVPKKELFVVAAVQVTIDGGDSACRLTWGLGQFGGFVEGRQEDIAAGARRLMSCWVTGFVETGSELSVCLQTNVSAGVWLRGQSYVQLWVVP
jgi:hypothetical protein